jgi:hypothetical protein
MGNSYENRDFDTSKRQNGVKLQTLPEKRRKKSDLKQFLIKYQTTNSDFPNSNFHECFQPINLDG